MKKLILDEEKCIGCGACIALDSKHFDFNDEGLSSVISQDDLESEDLQNAIHSCPVNAIKLADGDEKCACDNCHCDCHCERDEECSCEDCHCEHENK